MKIPSEYLCVHTTKPLARYQLKYLHKANLHNSKCASDIALIQYSLLTVLDTNGLNCMHAQYTIDKYHTTCTTCTT